MEFYLKEIWDWSSQWMDTFSFVNSPPWKMPPVEWHTGMLLKNKYCHSAQEVKATFAYYVNIHFSYYMHVYTEGSVRFKSWCSCLYPRPRPEYFYPLLINSSVRPLNFSQLAIDALIGLETSSENILFLTDSLLSIHLLSQIKTWKVYSKRSAICFQRDFHWISSYF